MLTMSEMEDKKLGRYERQTMLPEIRTGGQERLRAARVLVVGTRLALSGRCRNRAHRVGG